MSGCAEQLAEVGRWCSVAAAATPHTRSVRLPPPTISSQKNEKRTHHTAAADGDAKPARDGGEAGAGVTAAACLRIAARDVRTANALYAAYGNNDDGAAAAYGEGTFTIFTHREESDDEFSFFDSLSFLRTERNDDFGFGCYRRYPREAEVSVSSEANGAALSLSDFIFFHLNQS